MELIEFGADRHRVFELMPEKGVLAETLFRPTMFFAEFKEDPIPAEAALVLNEVSHFPIKQFIIGHEYPKVMPKRNLPVVKWETVAKVSLAVIGAVVVGYAVVVLAALAAALYVVDPCLIAVIDDGNESWVCLARWDE